MLPNSILNRFKRPAQMEEDFIKYLQAAGARIDNSKTIASVSYYHQLDGVLSNNLSFFTGTRVQGDTNLASFVRPQSEHALIYAIKLWQGDNGGVTIFDSNWTAGSSDSVLQNCQFSITNNSEVELKNYPVTDFQNDLTTKDQGTIFLDEPIIWLGQTELILRLNTATSGTTFSADTPVRFELVGIGLI